MEDLIAKIGSGDREALETLVKRIQKDVFNLSMRFLWVTEDAEDATQEILVKIVTNISRFENKSQFTTWVYRIAVNHLLNLKRNKLEREFNFSVFGNELDKGLEPPSADLPDKDLLAEEIKIGCTLGMLICLNRDLRIAYILGEIFQLKSKEAASILEITPENFRKRLSQSRQMIQGFMRSYCGIIRSSNKCRCSHRINYARKKGRLNSERLRFVSPEMVRKSKLEVEKLYTASSIFRSHPAFEMKKDLGREISGIIGKLKVLVP